MTFKDAKGAELTAFVHDRLDNRNPLQSLNRELRHILDELVPGDIRKTVLAVLP